nr:hypothetical protein [uncultured Methanoregula sp.]
MQRSLVAALLLAAACIAALFAAGCTSSSAPAVPSVPEMTAVPPTTQVLQQTIATPVATAPVTTSPVAIIVVTTTATASDPILHRWVRIVRGTTPQSGYEYKFYPEGTVVYRAGPAKMVSGNILIQEPYTTDTSGTWSKIGDNRYLVKIYPAGLSGAQVVSEYTLVPDYVDPAYPGVTIRAHIESKAETDAINKGISRHTDEMYYPEQAKID